MDYILEQLATDPWGRLALQYVASGGLQRVFVFVLVSARLSGLLIVAPYFTCIMIPISIRMGLVFFLSLVIAPALTSDDSRFNEISQVAYALPAIASIPGTLTELMGLIASEVALGTLFGVGLVTVFSGLRLGAEWLERHSGLSQGTISNPDWSAGSSASRSMIQMLGVTAFLLIDPIGGHWQLAQCLFQSFREFPVGSESWSTSTIAILTGAVQQSLILGVRIAMPLVATMTLVDVTLGFASRGAPLLFSSSNSIARLGVGLVTLALTTTSIPDVISTSLVACLRLATGSR